MTRCAFPPRIFLFVDGGATVYAVYIYYFLSLPQLRTMEGLGVKKGAFYSYIQEDYLVPGQAVQIRWYTHLYAYGMLTDDGNIQLADSFCVNQELPLITPSYCMNVSLGQKFKAPSTVTEQSYRDLQQTPIILPRNVKEQASSTYQGILDPSKVRHNGWRKIEFLFTIKGSLKVVALQAVHLRNKKTRESIRIKQLYPIMFHRLANACIPIDELSTVSCNLSNIQESDLFCRSSQIIERLREQSGTVVDWISVLVDKLARAECCLQNMYDNHLNMQSYMSERADMIKEQLRGGDTMLNGQPCMYDFQSVPEALPEGVFVEEVLESGQVNSSPEPPEYNNPWMPLYDVYKQLMDSAVKLQPEASKHRDLQSFYRFICDYRKSSTHNQLLQQFYSMIDEQYSENRLKIKDDLMECTSLIYKLLQQTMEDCGTDQAAYHDAILAEVEGADKRNELIREFKAMSELMHFADVALAERDGVITGLSQSSKLVQSREVDLLNSNKRLRIEDVHQVITYTHFKYVKKRGEPQPLEQQFVSKRMRV